MRVMILAVAVCLALSATKAAGQDVSYDFDKGADFSSYKTYAWVRGAELTDELNHKRVVAAIDSQLAAKGMIRVEATANPDMLISYNATFGKDLQIRGFSSGIGYRYGASRSGSASVNEVVVGTLTVNMVDAKTRSLVWRGVATRDVDTKASAEKRDKNVNKAAEKLLRNYPPKES